MIFLRWLIILLTLLFILFQRVDVRVTKGESLTVKISFVFFAIVFSERRSNKRKFKLSSLFKGRTKAALKAVKYLISGSDITLFDNKHVSDKEMPLIFNISFHFSLFRLIISLLIFLYYILKIKIKRVIKDV